MAHVRYNFLTTYPTKWILLFVLVLTFGNATAQNEVRTDVPLRVYKCSLSGPEKTINKEQIIDVIFIVENYRKQQSPVVDFCIYVPSGVSIIHGKGNHKIDKMSYRVTRGVSYKIKIKNDYANDIVPIEIWMSNDNMTLSPCYQATFKIGQTESFANVKPITHSSLNGDAVSSTSANGDAVSSTSTKDNQKPTTSRYRVVNTTKLNVRQSPSSKSRIVGSLSAGDHVEVYTIENGWARIMHKQQPAYISAKYIEPDPSKEEIKEEQPEIIIPESKQTVIASIPTDTLEQKSNKKNDSGLSLVSSLGMGFSNLTSPDAYSYGTFGMSAEVGLRYHWRFLPQNMFTDATIGFSLLGNKTNSFPYFSITLYPFEIAHKIFKKTFFGQVGFSLLIGGNDIHVVHGNFNKLYYANTCVALVLKESIELGRHWDIGLKYIRGLNNVCDNLPIGLYLESIQICASYKFGIK